MSDLITLSISRYEIVLPEVPESVRELAALLQTRIEKEILATLFADLLPPTTLDLRTPEPGAIRYGMVQLCGT
jgi:hypothetical protein